MQIVNQVIGQIPSAFLQNHIADYTTRVSGTWVKKQASQAQTTVLHYKRKQRHYCSKE